MDARTAAGVSRTPAYVFSLDEFAQRCRLTADILGSSIGLCYSIKANPFLLGTLPEVFRYIEVCSPGELTICEKTGMRMESIIFSGVNKQKADISRAIKDGVRIFTAESRLHFEMLRECSAQENAPLEVLLRLSAGSQLGMSREDIFAIIRERKSAPLLEIKGLHYFSVTQKKKPEKLEKELQLIEEFVQEVRAELGFSFERLEYGCGLAVDYFSEDRENTEPERLKAIAPALKSLSEKMDVTVEMGRFFAAPCGYYVTTVADAKTTDANYLICDGGINQLHYDGQIQAMQLPVIRHIPAERAEGEKTPWVVCGSLCTSADILARNLLLNDPKPGDRLVFTWCGAYSAMEGMALFLSRELPAVYLHTEEGGLKLVRDIIPADSFNTPCVFAK